MFTVEKLLPIALERLTTMSENTPVTGAAALLGDKSRNMVVICDDQGRISGIVTRTDIVREVSHCLGCACTMACKSIMTTELVVCRMRDRLNELWGTMKERSLRSVPIIDDAHRPLGLVTAYDALEAMLSEVEYEETMMKEYVMCMGYR